VPAHKSLHGSPAKNHENYNESATENTYVIDALDRIPDVDADLKLPAKVKFQLNIINWEKQAHISNHRLIFRNL
jgi:hypothetical protein